MTIKKTIFTLVALTMWLTCSVCVLLMTSQSVVHSIMGLGNCKTSKWKLISDTSVTDFIHFDIYDRSCKGVKFIRPYHVRLLHRDLIFPVQMEESWRMWVNLSTSDHKKQQRTPGTNCIRGRVYRKKISRAGLSNYIPQYLWDVITCPCHWYLLLVHKSSYHSGQQLVW